LIDSGGYVRSKPYSSTNDDTISDNNNDNNNNDNNNNNNKMMKGKDSKGQHAKKSTKGKPTSSSSVGMNNNNSNNNSSSSNSSSSNSSSSNSSSSSSNSSGVGKEQVPKPVIAAKPFPLDPPYAGASEYELVLRETLLSEITLYPNMQQNDAHRFMNAVNKALHQFCDVFDNSLDATWASLLMNRSNYDCITRMSNVLELMAEGSESVTVEVAKLGELKKKLISLTAGTMIMMIVMVMLLLMMMMMIRLLSVLPIMSEVVIRIL